MKNLKNMIAAITLVAILMIGTANAQKGVLLSELAGGTGGQCTNSQTDRDASGYTGIIVAGFTGIIVAGFTGIILSDNSRSQATLCRDGLLLSD